MTECSVGNQRKLLPGWQLNHTVRELPVVLARCLLDGFHPMGGEQPVLNRVMLETAHCRKLQGEGCAHSSAPSVRFLPCAVLGSNLRDFLDGGTQQQLVEVSQE